jgi:hypothetical protein
MSTLFDNVAAPTVQLTGNDAVMVLVTNPESPFGGVVIQMPAEIPVVVDFVTGVPQQFPVDGGGAMGPQGPAGAPGVRGSLWFQGNGDPAVPAADLLPNDLYLNTVNGDIWQYNGVSWRKITP